MAEVIAQLEKQVASQKTELEYARLKIQVLEERLRLQRIKKYFGAKEDRASCTWEKCSRSGTGFVEVGIYRASSRTAGAVGFGFSVSSHAEGVAVGRVPHASSS